MIFKLLSYFHITFRFLDAIKTIMKSKSLSLFFAHKQNVNFLFYLYKKISIIYPFKAIASLVTQKLSPEPLMLLKWDQDWLYLDEDDEDEDEDDLPPMLQLEDDEKEAKSEPEKTITEKVKLSPQKSKKKQKNNRNRNQNRNFKQHINHSSNTVSTNKSWK